MTIIPAIDIIDGKCVRLTQGDYGICTVYPDVPLDVAKQFEAAGLKRLHLVDLDGAKASGVVHLRVLEEICTHTSLEVDFGGGIKSDSDIHAVFEAGAKWACIGSLAQTDPRKTTDWLEWYGGDKILIGADVRDKRICIHGWKTVTDMTIFELIDGYQGKIRHLMCTDVFKDGTLEGPAFDLYRELLFRYPDINLIASGGVGGEEDLERLEALGVQAVVVGKAIHENRIKVKGTGY